MALPVEHWRDKPSPDDLLPATPEEMFAFLWQQAVWEVIQKRIRARIRLTHPRARPSSTPNPVPLSTTDARKSGAGSAQKDGASREAE